MTMIAFATYGDHAEIITDTSAYLPNGSFTGMSSKCMPITHLDAAVITQGDVKFGIDAKSGALQVAGRAASFDELTDDASRWLADLWTRRSAEPGQPRDSVVFLIGYSPRADQFVAHAYASEDGFKSVRVGAPWVMPTPWTMKPSMLELKRLLPEIVDKDWRTRIRDSWTSKPQLRKPTSEEAWVELARTVREQRALTGPHKVFVTGKVTHTRLERDAITSRTIFTFNDEGEEFLRMIEGTYHPIAQLMECSCDSGKRFIECCLAEDLDEPCGCGGAETFRECCAVTIESAARKVGASE